LLIEYEKSDESKTGYRYKKSPDSDSEKLKKIKSLKIGQYLTKLQA